MYCLNCGISLPDSAKFCPECGAVQNTTSKNENRTSVVAPDTLTTIATSENLDSPEKSKKRHIIRNILLLILIIFILIVALFFYNNYQRYQKIAGTWSTRIFICNADEETNLPQFDIYYRMNVTFSPDGTGSIYGEIEPSYYVLTDSYKNYAKDLIYKEAEDNGLSRSELQQRLLLNGQILDLAIDEYLATYFDNVASMYDTISNLVDVFDYSILGNSIYTGGAEYPYSIKGDILVLPGSIIGDETLISEDESITFTRIAN